MIQFKRGTTKSWRTAKVKLASGQPGYDKDKHKLKIGDGKTTWDELPYASGLSAQEILDSEESARARQEKDGEDKTLITYGTKTPDKDTAGQVYLQQFDAEPETDYIVKSGINGIWIYQQWKSGIARCYGILEVEATVHTSVEGTGLFHNSDKMKGVNYPFTFKKIPVETATIQGPGGLVWLANHTRNTEKISGIYTILSVDEQLSNAKYSIYLLFWHTESAAADAAAGSIPVLLPSTRTTANILHIGNRH